MKKPSTTKPTPARRRKLPVERVSPDETGRPPESSLRLVPEHAPPHVQGDPLVAWIAGKIAAMVATVGVLVYLISYWFFDGYLTRYGYSMRAIPHDYAAIMMESFLLVFHGLLVALSSPSWVYVLLALIGGMLIYLWLVLGVGVVIGAAVKSWQVRRRLRLKNGGQWWVQVRPPTWLAAHLDPIKRMAAKSLVGALLPLLLTAFLLCAGLVLVISVLGAYRFGIWVASEEIKSFVSCDKRDVARCATYKTKANATITGEVIAGTATTLLVFDGTNAYLLQRSDALSAESRAK